MIVSTILLSLLSSLSAAVPLSSAVTQLSDGKSIKV
jgi:hypothetical protein